MDIWKAPSELNTIMRVINGCTIKKQFDNLLKGKRILADNKRPIKPVNKIIVCLQRIKIKIKEPVFLLDSKRKQNSSFSNNHVQSVKRTKLDWKKMPVIEDPMLDSKKLMRRILARWIYFDSNRWIPISFWTAN